MQKYIFSVGKQKKLIFIMDMAMKKIYVDYPVKVNSAVTDSHRMCENF